MFSPVAEQKVEIQEERKTSFTIVPRKEQLTAANRDQKKSIYESVSKAQIMEQERLKLLKFNNKIFVDFKKKNIFFEKSLTYCKTSSAKGHAAILSELSSLKEQIAAFKNKNSKAQVPVLTLLSSYRLIQSF